ncbi:MAG: helix-turn-helix transcriptional regulator [Saprospiraceae bacterium]|nr:helix-turn-helix transcriptional regulator [Saprospiraceae bacterium]MBK9631714.1 helix-turn-helix transcriptional regulator [Saprospiraceae bacterium]
MKLYIKYMVSIRCKNLVKFELQQMGIPFLSIDLGMVELPSEISEDDFAHLKKKLLKSGLELMDDKRSLLIDQAKNLIKDMNYYSEEMPEESYADYISRKLDCDYNYLAGIFSEVKGTTIQKYIIQHKVERVKELLIYDELSLTEISYKLQYSSVAHLSNQFKKITGLSPSFFKQLKLERKSNLAKLANM